MNTYHHHYYENHKFRYASFIQYLYKTYASKLKELQRTPLGICSTSWSTLSTVLMKEVCVCVCVF